MFKNLKLSAKIINKKIEVVGFKQGILMKFKDMLKIELKKKIEDENLDYLDIVE